MVFQPPQRTQRAYSERPAGFFHGSQAAPFGWLRAKGGQRTQSDDVGRLGEPLLHLQHQRGAAGHQARVVAVTLQHLQHVVQRRRVMELEIEH